MNTSKQNALIAEFMGLSYCTKHNYEGWYKNNEHNHRICSYDGLEYHKDWNLLIRVAEKIKSLGYFVDMKYLGTTYGSIKKSWDDMTELVHISDLPNPFVSNPPTALNPMFIHEFNDPKEAFYNLLFRFVKWYNENVINQNN